MPFQFKINDIISNYLVKPQYYVYCNFVYMYDSTDRLSTEEMLIRHIDLFKLEIESTYRID